MTQTRRLAAILAADVAGYSRLMGKDEEGTHARLQAHIAQLVEPKLKEHRRRIVKNNGDGFLAEFGSVVDAVRWVLMQSGIGDGSELTRAGVDVVQHLPGVGRNFTDQILVPCVWEFRAPLSFRNNGGEATLFWKSDPSLDTPDLQPILAEAPFATAETAHFLPPEPSWSMFVSIVRPHSRGHLRITGPSPSDPIEIVANTFSDPADMTAMIRAIELCREIGNSAGMRPFVRREIMPDNLKAARLRVSCEMRP